MTVKLYKEFANTSILSVIGDVQTVINGYVNNTNMKRDVLNHLKFGLGAGSFSDCTCIGETIVLNQIGYNCYLNHDNKLITNKKASGLKTPFLMGLQPGCQPTHLLEINYPKGITLNKLFEELGVEFDAYAFVGCILFKNLSCSYLKKAPIFKENINQNSDSYWATTEEHPDTYAYVFGVVIKETGKKKFPPPTLQKAFYINPLEKNHGSFLSHTHAVLVKKPPSFTNLKQDIEFYEKLEVYSDIEVRHIFAQSIAKNGLLALFNLH